MMNAVPTLEQRLAVRERPLGRLAAMYQQWRDLLFVHWTIDPAIVQRTLPRGLTVDTFEGRAYLGVVPFFMRNIRPKFLPAVPGISNFLEMNVRTYVYDRHGTPGVWFYSLDANQWLAVRIARRFFHLPYFDAKINATKTDRIRYEAHRKGADTSSLFEYRELDEVPDASPESLEFFLAERYILFAYDQHRQQLYSGQVHHVPYPLRRVEVSIQRESALAQAGFQRPDRDPDHLIMSPGVDVEVFSLTKVE